MPIEVNCQCGSRFAAKDQLAGKRVACPACGGELHVPHPQNSRPSGGPFVVACECGARFQAQPHLLGKRVPCPTCHQPLTIRQTAEESVSAKPSSVDLGAIDTLPAYGAAPSYMSTRPLPVPNQANRGSSNINVGKIVKVAVIAGAVIGLVVLLAVGGSWGFKALRNVARSTAANTLTPVLSSSPNSSSPSSSVPQGVGPVSESRRQESTTTSVNGKSVTITRTITTTTVTDGASGNSSVPPPNIPTPNMPTPNPFVPTPPTNPFANPSPPSSPPSMPTMPSIPRPNFPSPPRPTFRTPVVVFGLPMGTMSNGAGLNMPGFPAPPPVPGGAAPAAGGARNPFENLENAILTAAMLEALKQAERDRQEAEKKALEEALKSVKLGPKMFGFNIPDGPTRAEPKTVRHVVTRDEESDEPVVAKLYCEVGENRIVLLPDGQLVSRSFNETTDTERPFTPLTADEMIYRVKRGRFENFKSKKSDYFICIYDSGDEFANIIIRNLDALLKGIVAQMKEHGITVERPPAPMVAIAFKNESDFREFSRTPPGVLAYYSPVTNRVVMHEDSPLYKIKPQLGIQDSLATINHEGTHQILANIGVERRLSRWPMWLSEGIAEYFSATNVTSKRYDWPGPGRVNDWRMFELETYLKSRDNLKSEGKLVSDSIEAYKLTSVGYASSWSLVHFLMKKKRDKMGDYLKQLSELKPFEGNLSIEMPGVIPANRDEFNTFFGSDYRDMENMIVEHLKKLPYNDPFADETHYSAFIEGPGRKKKRDANVFHTRTQAFRWVAEQMDPLSKIELASSSASVSRHPSRAAAVKAASAWIRGR